MEEMWELAGRARRTRDELSEAEVEEALADVHQRLDSNAAANNIPRYRWWWAAAAVILIVFGAGILFTPKTVTAPRGEIVKATLPDGSTVTLNSGTEIEYSRLFSWTNRRVELEGEAYFSVKKGQHPFLVEANKAVVRVTGTQFNVRSWSEDQPVHTEVTVVEGTVRFYPSVQPAHFVTLQQGEQSRWMARMKEPRAPQPVDVNKTIGWRAHQLMFNEEPLRVIFNELERRFDVTIRLENRRYADEALTAFYSKPENVESVIKDICRVKGLRYAKTANGYRVYN